MLENIIRDELNENNIPQTITISTLMGDREFRWDKAIYMPAGLSGFSDNNVFALANFPSEISNSFKLLQCLTDPELAFIVAPYNTESGLIAHEDIDPLAASHGIAQENLAIILIITLQKADGAQDVEMTVNLRAPILIDTNRQTAFQVRLNRPQYDFRHPLTV
jgi:flagellar assembly factor FliW